MYCAARWRRHGKMLWLRVMSRRRQRLRYRRNSLLNNSSTAAAGVTRSAPSISMCSEPFSKIATLPGAAMNYQNLLIETHGRVGVIRLNRPQRMNALNDALAAELATALAEFDADVGIGAILITGSDKAFAADAAEAERSGLVARVVPAEKLDEEALAVATKIASYSLPVVLKVKEAINRAYESSLAEGLLFERREFHATFALDDQKEGMRAFVEKRKPEFKHR